MYDDSAWCDIAIASSDHHRLPVRRYRYLVHLLCHCTGHCVQLVEACQRCRVGIRVGVVGTIEYSLHAGLLLLMMMNWSKRVRGAVLGSVLALLGLSSRFDDDKQMC